MGSALVAYRKARTDEELRTAGGNMIDTICVAVIKLRIYGTTAHLIHNLKYAMPF